MKKINIRILLIILAILVLLAGIGYKYFEWNTVRGLSELYNSSWKQEFKIVEGNIKKSDDFFKFQADTYSSKDPTSFTKNYEELNGKLNLYLNNAEQYKKIIDENRVKYDSIKKVSVFLLGKQGDFVKETVNLQLNYYDNESENAKKNITGLFLWSDLLSVFYDKSLVDAYDKKIGSDKKNVSKYFSDISTVQSYTNSDFKFSHEEDIKKYYPEGYNSLQKYKDFLTTYYLVVRDMVNGDYESAAYKYTTISNNIANLTLNYKGIFTTEQDDQRINRARDIVDEVSKQADQIKQFRKNNLGRYPLLPPISIWKEDLVLCQMYDFKAVTLFKNVTAKYPSSKNFNDLLSELNSVNPKTDFIDSDFDKSIVNYTNDDKKIEFQCKDKFDGDTLTFTFTKPVN